MYEIDPDRIDLAEEFRANIYGRHSGELQRVLNRMRGGEPAGRYVLIAEDRTARTWLLARLGPQRGDAPIPVPGYRFTGAAEAEWTVFKLRWKDLTGRELPLK